MKQQEIKDAIRILRANFDKVRVFKTQSAVQFNRMPAGTIEVKKTFFYRNGWSAYRLAAAVLRKVPGAELVSYYEEWKAWPKTSYFAVRIRLAPDTLPATRCPHCHRWMVNQENAPAGSQFSHTPCVYAPVDNNDSEIVG
jgi:hypothetical protein